MSPTLHKVLIHGSSIIGSSNIPVGELSEEALEANHKVIKLFRTHFSRKTSRTNANTDIFHRLLLRSDPLITMTGKIFREKKVRPEKLHPDTLLLLDMTTTESESEQSVSLESDTSDDSDTDNDSDNE